MLCAKQALRQVRQSLVRGDTDMDDVKFAVHDETASARRPHYYGVHHLALNTDDMKMTVDFYVGVIGTMQHVAFAVSPETAEQLHARLTERGIDCQLVEHAPGQKYSLYFYDPNGIRLELFWQPADGEEPRVIDAFTQTKIKAREELKTLTADEAWLEWATAGLRS